MGRVDALAPEARALRHSESVLLVYHGQSEAREAHRVLHHGVSAHEYIHLSRHQTLEHIAAPASLDSSGEQFHSHVHVAQEIAYGVQMLFGENLCRSHDARLIAVAHGYEHGHECHERLARAHIALQQTVHLLARTHVVVYLMHHPLLRSGERERQMLIKERAQQVAGASEDVAPVATAAVAHVAHYVELDIEQFLKLEPLARTLHVVYAVRIVDVAHGRVARHQMQRSGDERRKRLGDNVGNAVEQCLHHLLYGMRVKSVLLHALGGAVIRLQSHLRDVELRCLVYVGMGELESPVEDGGTSEDYIFLANLVLLIYVLSASEPHDIHHPHSVGEVGDDAFLPRTGGELLETEYPPLYLHVGHVARQLADAVNAAAVNIFVGIIFEHLSPRGDIDILFQNVPASRADTWQEFYVLVEYIVQLRVFKSDSAILRSNGVVSFMFSRLPSTIVTRWPAASTTEASSVNDSL